MCSYEGIWVYTPTLANIYVCCNGKFSLLHYLDTAQLERSVE
jgi:hypothetical protein